MCDGLVCAFQKILTIKYSEAESGRDFQQRIMRILNKYLPKNKLIYEMIDQPNGSQMFPDLQLNGWNITPINIEIKRGGGGTIMWNEGYPKTGNNIYIFNGKCKIGDKKNFHFIEGTTFFLGNDVINSQEEKFLLNAKHQLKQFTQSFSCQTGSRWRLSYIRPQFSECYQSDKLYLTHIHKQNRESNVLNFLKNA